MTDADLKQYVSEWVEVQLTSGRTFIGQLVTSDPHVPLTAPYAIKSPPAGSNEGPSFTEIPNASMVLTARVLQGPPEMID